MRTWIALAATMLLAACAVTQPNTFTGQFERPPAQSRVVVMTPDVQLNIMGAAGQLEPREDWSVSARDNLAASVTAYLQGKSHTPSALDPSTAMDGRIGQIIRLHSAVGVSLIQRAALPTQRDRFEWTLGEGVREVGTAYSADYALFVGASGAYASGGRVVTMVALAALGVGVPLGNQVAYASLVDLRTGNVIWFNTVLASPGQDMRDAGGATSLVETLMRSAPL